MHNPTHKPLPNLWCIEGPTYVGGSFESRRLLIDRSTGQFVDCNATGHEPNVVLGPDQRIVPGFLDIHVHCREDPSGSENYKEDFTSASRAALHGGVVLVADMPNNPQAPVDDESYEQKREVADARSLIDIVLYAGVTPGGAPLTTNVPYKCYFGPSIGSLNLTHDDVVSDVLAPYRDQFIVFHAESLQVLEQSKGAPTHEERRPAEAEAQAIRDITAVAETLPFHVHIAHLSSAAGLEEVRNARARGLDVTCEVAPHHLFFDIENRSQFEHGDWLQMNPPLRGPEDRAALRAGFESGEIDCLATDHAPHSLAENQTGISGVPHLDTYGAFLTLLASEGVPWSTLIERAATRPAALFDAYFEGKLGVIEDGALASFAVIDESQPWRVEARDVSTRASWSPFEGVEFPGRVAMTAVRGALYVMT